MHFSFYTSKLPGIDRFLQTAVCDIQASSKYDGYPSKQKPPRALFKVNPANRLFRKKTLKGLRFVISMLSCCY